MKKLFIILTAALIFLGAGTSAYAADTATINSDTFTATVSADCQGAEYALVLITNRESGNYVWASQETVSGGTLNLSAKLDSSIETGWYDVAVTDNAKGTVRMSFYFATVQDRNDLLDEINGLKNNTATANSELERILNDAAPLFGYNKEMFAKIEDTATLYSRIAAGTYTSLDDFSEQIDVIVGDMYILQSRGTAIEEFNDASASGMTDVLERYYDLFGITLDSVYYENSLMINGVLAGLTISDIDEVAPVFEKIVAVGAVNSAERSELMDVFKSYDRYLGLYSRLSSLSTEELSAVLKIVEQKTYTNAADIAEDISSVLADMPVETSPSYDEKTSNIITVSNELLNSARPQIIQDVNGDGSVFYDLDGAPWAKESILKLYELGVVNGRTETEFAPNELITRAEFAQLIVKAFELKSDAEAENFDDVEADKWYFASVMTARAANVIAGDKDNCFNPGHKLTKQDAAAIICRALGLDEVTDGEDFSDDSAIADYARGAVYALRNAGIVNGTPDGMFEPESSATRAQCAVMICASLEVR